MLAFGPIMSAFGMAIDLEHIRIIPPNVTKQEALDLLIGAVAASDCVEDAAAFQRAVHEREAVMSTGIGGGIAIPHVRIPEVRYASMGVAISREGIEYGTLDNKPVHIMVLFATPQGADKEYLSLLAQVMAALKNRKLYNRLVTCETVEDVYRVLSEDDV